MSAGRPKTHVATSTPVRHHFWDGDGVRTHALEFVASEPGASDSRGDDPQPPVVLVHGVGGSAWTFAPLVEAWAPSRRCFAVDMQGYGASSWLDGDYGTGRQVEHLAGVVEELATPVVDLLGFSWGGLVAIELAAGALRHCVRRLVVVDIAPSSAMSETEVPRIPSEHGSPLEALAVGRALAPRADEMVLERDAHLTVGCRGPGRWIKAIDPGLLARWRFRSEDHWAAWESLACPTLLVRGAESPVLSAEEAHLMVRRLSGCSCAEIADTGHLVPLERPAELAAVLAAFLSA